MTKASTNSTATGSRKRSRSKRGSRGADEEIAHKILLLLITTRNLAEIKKQCIEKLGLTAKQAAETIETACGKIAEAAVWSRDIEAGKALLRLDDLYERSLRVQDTKTALAVERERVKLLGLYEKKRVEEQETIENAEWEPV